MLWSMKAAISITVNFIVNYYLGIKYDFQLKRSNTTVLYIFREIKGLSKGREV